MAETPQNNRIRLGGQGRRGLRLRARARILRARLPRALRDWRVQAGVAAAAVAVALALYFGGGTSLTTRQPAATAKVAEWPGEYGLGDVNAPVQVLEYHSLTCSHCAHFAETAFPAIKKAYIDTGKVRYIARAFPLNAIDVSAFMVARCLDHSHYFDAVDLVYRTQTTWFTPDQDTDTIMNNLADVMRQAGLSRTAFDQCLKSTETLTRLRKEQFDGDQQFRVNSTPTFIINGEVQSGDMTFEAFQKAVDPLIAASGGRAGGSAKP